MEQHPVTNIIGIICGIFLVLLVSLGFSCMMYTYYPQEYEIIKPYYEWAKTKKVC